jgi:hypothetical protein
MNISTAIDISPGQRIRSVLFPHGNDRGTGLLSHRQLRAMAQQIASLADAALIIAESHCIHL